MLTVNCMKKNVINISKAFVYFQCLCFFFNFQLICWTCSHGSHKKRLVLFLQPNGPYHTTLVQKPSVFVSPRASLEEAMGSNTQRLNVFVASLLQSDMNHFMSLARDG